MNCIRRYMDDFHDQYKNIDPEGKRPVQHHQVSVCERIIGRQDHNTSGPLGV